MAATQSKTEKTLNRILDAALSCYQQSGITGTRLEDVAKSAGIGRTTLYRYIANREDLLNQVVLRDAAEQQAELAILNRYQNKLVDSIVENIVLVMRGRRNRPINKLLFASGDSASIDHINLSPANFYPMVEALLAPQFEQAKAAGEIRDGVSLAQASHWMARVVLSLITYPEEFLTDEDALRNFLHAFLVPSLIKDT